MRHSFILGAFCALCCACGPKLPPRYVVEKDIGGYRYARYQQVLDIEIPVAGNPAVAHTATYVQGGSQVHVAPVVITTYQQAQGLTEAVRNALRGMQSYTLDVTEVAGDNVWRMRGQSGDLWALWVSDHFLVKLGAPEGEKELPPKLLETYVDLYPSDLDQRGHARKGSASAGPAPNSSEPSSESSQP